MKQESLFGAEFEAKQESAYTTKIALPTYEPSRRQPHIVELIDTSKAKRLTAEIKSSGVSDLEKQFLMEAARRHSVFHYERIADYYAHATPEMQRLMEASALVIIDFDQAYARGYVQLANEIANIYVGLHEK